MAECRHNSTDITSAGKSFQTRWSTTGNSHAFVVQNMHILLVIQVLSKGD